MRDYLLSVFFFTAKKEKKIRATNLHLKWNIVGLGFKQGRLEGKGIPANRKTQFVFYLFALIVGAVRSNQLGSSDGLDRAAAAFTGKVAFLLGRRREQQAFAERAPFPQRRHL